MPMDLGAEQATLGALLIDRDAIIAVGSWLRAEHFSLEKYAVVYDAVRRCYQRGVPPDIRTISDELRRAGWLDAIGGIPFLTQLTCVTPTAVHIEYYARIVERNAMLRRLIEAGGTITALGYNEQLDDADRATAVQEVLHRALSRPGLHRAMSPMEAVNEITEFVSATSSRGIPTGFAGLDRLLDGLHRDDLVLLAGRPGMGKTSFVLQLLQNVSVAGYATLMCSLEMSKVQLMLRVVASRTGIDLMTLRRRQLSDAQLVALMQSLGELSGLSFYIDDSSALSLDELRIKACALQTELALRDQQLDLIIVDYIQLMRTPDLGRRSTSRTEDVSALSRGLKQLARELRVPVIALCQLNRGPEGRADHVPMLADLRDSGSLEQDADIVMFVYRDEVYNPQTARAGGAELHIAKHRNGPTGVVHLHFDGPTQRWRDSDNSTPAGT